MEHNEIIHPFQEFKKREEQRYSERQRFDGNLDFISLVDVLYTLFELTWGADWGVFAMEKPKTLDAKNVKFPTIVIQLEKMEPGEIGNGKRERKPRERGQYQYKTKDTGEVRTVKEYAQKMDSIISFTVYAESNKQAIEYSQELMDIIHEYKGFLQKSGIQNIWFEEERKEETSERESVIARKVIYKASFEKIYVGTPKNIPELTVEGKTLAETLTERLRKVKKEGLLPSQQKHKED